MLGITMGAVIGTEIGKEPEPCVVGDIADIQARVGGHFDCVRTEIGDPDGTEHMFTLVGYVHDEGRIMEPPLDVNIMASMIFNQELRGACVILSGTNPETKAYDGENYDLPAVFYEFLCKKMTKDIEHSVRFTQMVATAVGMAKKAKVITAEEYIYISATVNSLGENSVGGDISGLPERCRELMEKCMSHMVNSVLDVLGEGE